MGAPDPFHMDATRLRLAPDARRYIQATMSYVSVVGLTVAMDQLLGRGIDQVEEHAGRLAGQLVETVEPKGWSPFRRPEDAAASPHIVSLGHPSHDLAETTDRLWAAGIVCSARGGRVRVSLAPYNDEEDIARLVDALPA
jgi:selenocysteine lyase/cysteine desulfurase